MEISTLNRIIVLVIVIIIVSAIFLFLNFFDAGGQCLADPLAYHQKVENTSCFCMNTLIGL